MVIEIPSFYPQFFFTVHHSIPFTFHFRVMCNPPFLVFAHVSLTAKKNEKEK